MIKGLKIYVYILSMQDLIITDGGILANQMEIKKGVNHSNNKERCSAGNLDDPL